MVPTPDNGRLIQSTYAVASSPANFEAVVLEGTTPETQALVHYWRNNADPNLPWLRGPVISSIPSSSGSLIQSTYGTPQNPGNFELLVLEGSNLVHYWRDNSNGNVWNKGPVVSDRATGAASLIQSSYVGKPGSPANFEAVVLEGSNLVHYWRDNSNGNVWNKGPVITSHATDPGSLIQSTYIGKPGAPGNFEVVVPEGHNLVHYWRDNSNGNVWNKGPFITNRVNTNGPGTLIQGSYVGKPGAPANFELVVQEGSTLVHYWRDNSNGNVWNKGPIITTTAHGPGSLIQSSFGEPSDPGNLEVIVVESDDNLVHYYRDDTIPGNLWHKTVTISHPARG
jgi:hypothetical protein